MMLMLQRLNGLQCLDLLLLLLLLQLELQLRQECRGAGGGVLLAAGGCGRACQDG